MLTTKTTLTIPERALRAAESLASALRDLNAADGPFASGDASWPYGAVQAALRVTLHAFVADSDPDVTEAFANFVIEYLPDNGESVEYQITQVLGWTLVLFATASDDPQVARTVQGADANYRHLAPSILGGSR